ncbi:MAG: lysylphosphatidylglycerol synthase transmembrane domain-containing protein, partial [Vicinamibacterales bacterium]
VAASIAILVRVDLDDVLRAFGDARYEWLVTASAVSFLTMAIRAERWRLICQPVPVSFSRSFGVLSVGASLSSLLPLRLGDLARVYLIGDLERRSKAWAFATLVFERVLDILVLLAIIVLLLPFVSLPGWAAESAWIAAALAAAGVVAIVAAWFGRSLIEQRAASLGRFLPGAVASRLRPLIKPSVDGLAVLGEPWPLLRAVWWSAILWAATGVIMWSTLVAFGVDASPSLAMLLVIVSAITVAVPLSPSAVGVFHAAIVQVLIVAAPVDSSVAASVAITSHALLFAPPVICGLAAVWLMPEITSRLTMWQARPREIVAITNVPGESGLSG